MLHSNGKVPSFSNTAKQTQSKVRFIKTLKGEKIKGEPIVFSSNRKSPLSIFSSIPFNKQQQFVFTFRDSLKEHGKRRHTSSSSRQLSTILDGPEPLNLFEMMGLDRPTEGRDISFQHLLNGQYAGSANSAALNNNSATFLNQNQLGSRPNATNKRKPPLLTQHSVIDYSSADCASLSCQKQHQTSVLNQILVSNCNSISSNHFNHQSFHQSIHAHQQSANNTHVAASRCVSLEQTQKSTDQPDAFMYEQLSNEYYKSKIQPVAYDANLLDDPELIAGKHSTLLVFPSFVVSTLMKCH